MGWRKMVMLAMLLGMETGCPEEWGKGGTVDRAVAKDVKANLEHQQFCADGSPAEWHCEGEGPAKECGWKCPE